MDYLERIYQSDTARYVDALEAAQPDYGDNIAAFDPRHDMRAHQDTLELVWEQTQARIDNAFINDLRAYAKTQPAFTLYHVAHWCECGTLISHSQNAFNAHKGHGGFINIDLGGAA